MSSAPGCARLFACARVVAVVAIIGGVAGAGWYGRGRGLRAWLGRVTGISRPARREPPRVIVSRPGDGERVVPTGTDVMIKVYLPNGSLDPTTVSHTSVFVTRVADGARVPAAVGISQNGIFLTIKPTSPLDGNTDYAVRITDGVRDRLGTRFVPFTMSFATGSPPDPTIAFERVALAAANGVGFTCVEFGPDGRLYAAADDGRIFRYDVRPDGTVGPAYIITSLQAANGGARLLTGFCFDPRSTPQQPTVWASHGYYGFQDAPDWTGTVSQLSGPDLCNVRDVLVHLPRSVRDHLTNQPRFGPDGALYIPQPSNTAFGAPDTLWGQRPERTLSATILRLDVGEGRDGAIDALTPDGGGAYDPAAPDAPLTVYADGVRLAYDLLWHSNGNLYAPVNGSSAGGNAPAGGDAPALNNIPLSEHDWLFKIRRGRYYGHPNPRRGHYVLNGGNPTAGPDPAEVAQYPVGTRPDAAWDRAIYDFGDHVSPNGIIEYRSAAFGGRLRHKILVCRYNLGSDILCIGLDDDGNVSSAQAGIPGFTGLTNPLDLAEDPSTGCLYVAEYGRQCVTLLRPRVAPPSPRN